MGKKVKASQQAHIPEIEQQRMITIAANSARMKLVGLNSLVNKELQDKYERQSRGIVDEAQEEEDMNCQPEVQTNTHNARGKKERKPLVQTLPMDEFSRFKSQERQQHHKKGQHKPPVLSEDSTRSKRQPPQNLVEKEQRKKQPSHASVNQQDNSKNYCPPGSLAKFLSLRKRKESRGEQSKDTRVQDLDEELSMDEEDLSLRTDQESRGQQSNDMGPRILHDDVSLDDEDFNSQLPSTGKEVEGNDAQEVEESYRNEEAIVPVVVAGKESAVTQEKRHRGRTILAEVHARTMENRLPIILNSDCQPVGPTIAVVNELRLFLGTVAKNSTLAPLNFISWKYVPTKENIWEYVKEKMKERQATLDGTNRNSDPYYDVLTKKEHCGRLRLHGRSVSRSTRVRKDMKNPFILPPVFLESITQHFEQKVMEQVDQQVQVRVEEKVSHLLSKIREANPGIELVVPHSPTSEGDELTSNDSLAGQSKSP